MRMVLKLETEDGRWLGELKIATDDEWPEDQDAIDAMEEAYWWHPDDNDFEGEIHEMLSMAVKLEKKRA